MDARIIFRYLAGLWFIRKDISDIGIFTGQACFLIVDDQNMKYREDVSFLKTNQVKSFAVHKYFIKNDNLYMQFMNQEKSFKLDINGDEACGLYNCGKDIYNTTVNFLDINNFSITCKISGGKDHKIISNFKKIK